MYSLFHLLAELIPVLFGISFVVFPILTFRTKKRPLTIIYWIFVLVSIPILMLGGSVVLDPIAHCQGGDVAFSCQNATLAPVMRFLNFGGGWGSLAPLLLSMLLTFIAWIIFLVVYGSVRSRAKTIG